LNGKYLFQPRPEMIDQDVCFGITDIGLKRESNQDQFLIARLNKSMLVGATSLAVDESRRLFGHTQGQLMLVADGMGGHAAGEQASSMAIDLLVDRLLNRVHWFFKLATDAEQDFIESLKAMLRETHSQIQKAGRSNQSFDGMGTTLTMTYLIWPKMYVLHAGDSRCYLVRNQQVQRLTTDHTLARRMIETGGMKPEDEAGSRWSNVLWNVLGGKSDAELTAEVRSVNLEEGDAIVLCTDGLHRNLSDAQMVQILEEYPSAKEACEAFVRVANDAGGDDNVTVIVARPEPPPGLASTTTVEVETSGDDVLNFETYNPHDTLPS
jgi:serine/threonine protein phosphatase PrpC